MLIVMVEDPEPETELGLKLAVAPDGNPLTPKVTFPVNPLEGVTLTVLFVPLAGATVWEDGVAETEKSAGAVVAVS